MPIPKPSENESKDDFISRCMADDTMNSEYPDKEQRAAVCYSQWEGKAMTDGQVKAEPEDTDMRDEAESVKAVYGELFKTVLSQFSNDKVTVYLVDGCSIRNPLIEPYWEDFTEGDNDAHSKSVGSNLVPPNEVWVDLDVSPVELRAVILHELTERRFMITDGMDYDKAHDMANKAEENGRKYVHLLNDLIADELKIAPRFEDEEPEDTEENGEMSGTVPVVKSIEPETNTTATSDAKVNINIVPARGEKMAKSIIRRSVNIIHQKSSDGLDEIRITTPNFDRGNDRVYPLGAMLENYNNNPVIMWLHDYHGHTASGGIPIARCPYLKVSEDAIISGPPQFLENDPFAQRVKNAWEQGFIKTASIGFAPIDCEENERGGMDYKTWEMLEYSLVPIPMNAEACRIAKSAGYYDLVEHGISQDEIQDVLDEALTHIKGWDLNQKNQLIAKLILAELQVRFPDLRKRCAECDNSDNIGAKGDILLTSIDSYIEKLRKR